MMKPMTGFARTAPSYESGYTVDSPIDQLKAPFGYVFPGLFKVHGDNWLLISETGVGSNYYASHLSNNKERMLTVEYPQKEQNNGFGSTAAQIGLQGTLLAYLPWVNLKPIVETTILLMSWSHFMLLLNL